MNNRWLMLLALAVVATACGGGGDTATKTTKTDTAPPAAAAGPTGTITGTITYANGDPDVNIDMNADQVCADLHDAPVQTEQVVGDEGKLANVFVYVKSGLSGSYSAPGEAHLLDQKGCKYTPHVSGVMVGQEIVIRNSDETLHNVHALPTKNAEFNQGQPFAGMEIKKKFDTPEVMVKFKCDVHPWMAAYMAVLEHPFYAVSAADGTFTIDDLPAGEYEIEAWHEKMGAKTKMVTVSADSVSAASFDYTPAAG